MPNKKDDDYSVQMPDGNYEMDDLDRERRPGSPYSSSLLARQPVQPASPLSAIANNPTASILGYCLASISMTVVNKYVVSGSGWNLMFLYLAIQVSYPMPACWYGECSLSSPKQRLTSTQSIVCILAILVCKQMGFLSLEKFNTDNAKQCRSLNKPTVQ